MAASIAHWRGGRIDWRLFWLMALPSLLGGIAGGLLSGVLPKRILLGAIAIVVLYGAVAIARHNNRPQPEEPPSGGVGVALTIAFAVGVLGGLVGLILGTLRLPAMVKWLGTTPKAAVGTNAAIGTLVGLGGRLDDAALLKVISAILVVAGLVLGGRPCWAKEEAVGHSGGASRSGSAECFKPRSGTNIVSEANIGTAGVTHGLPSGAHIPTA